MSNLDEIFDLPPKEPEKPEPAAQPSAEVRRLIGEGRETEAVALAEKAAEALDADARTQVAALLAREDFRRYHPRRAQEWYIRAAEQDHLPAIPPAARAFLQGIHGLERNPLRAYHLLQRGLSAGDAESAWLLAQLIEDEQVPGSPAEYRQALLAAARQGHSEALATLANDCFDGRPEMGIPRDLVTAHRCLTRMSAIAIEEIYQAGRDGLAKIEPEMTREQITLALSSTNLEPAFDNRTPKAQPEPPQSSPREHPERHNLFRKLVVVGEGLGVRDSPELIWRILETGAAVSTTLTPAADLLVISDDARNRAEAGLPSPEVVEAAGLRQQGKLRIVSRSDFQAVLDGTAKMKW